MLPVKTSSALSGCGNSRLYHREFPKSKTPFLFLSIIKLKAHFEKELRFQFSKMGASAFVSLAADGESCRQKKGPAR